MLDQLLAEVVTPPNQVRLFKRVPRTGMLYFANSFIASQTKIFVREPVAMCYDHRSKAALPFSLTKATIPEEVFVLADELFGPHILARLLNGDTSVPILAIQAMALQDTDVRGALLATVDDKRAAGLTEVGRQIYHTLLMANQARWVVSED